MAGLGSAAVAILHILIMVIGAPAYRYFGAGEPLSTMAESGSIFPTLITTGITIVFFVFALYAFAGSQLIRPLPLMKPVLTAIGAIFSLRGIAVLYFGYLYLATKEPEYLKDGTFSLVSLVIGVLYLVGLTGGLRSERQQQHL